MPWLGAVIVSAMAALVLLLQCQTMPHHSSTAQAPPHHAVAAGSLLQRSDVAAGAHNHIGRAATVVCAVADVVKAQLSTPTVLRVLWTAALALLAYAVFVAVLPMSMRGPPLHTGPAAIAAGRILIHRFCVLRR